jgi:tetratricopeptide (TPR) repeat protein
MRSHFNSYTLAEILSDLYHTERSGVLSLEHQGLEKRIHFDRGMILFAESGAADEDLGAVLVRDGRVSAGALAEAQRSLGPEATAHDLARSLVQRDLIGRSAVSQAMAEIVDRVVQSAFSWEDAGQAVFAERVQPDAVFETDILTTVEVILNGVFCMSGFETVYEALRGTQSRVRVRDPVPIPVERLSLSATHGFILSRVDANTTVNDLLAILPAEEEEVAARFLFGLLVLGVLEFDPPLSDDSSRVSDLVQVHADRQALERVQEQSVRQKYEQLRKQNHYEVLGVRTVATRTEIERAYEQLKSQYGRDRLAPRVRENLRSQLSVIESRLVEAFLTLTQVAAPGRSSARREARQSKQDVTAHDFAVRVELDRAKSKVEADQATRVADKYFAKGKRCMREGDFHNAIQYGKLAISHNASDARYFCLLADCQMRNPGGRWQRMAEENYIRATQLDPWNADYWISLARLYKRRGMRLRARRNYEEALKLLPNKPELIQELASLER